MAAQRSLQLVVILVHCLKLVICFEVIIAAVKSLITYSDDFN